MWILLLRHIKGRHYCQAMKRIQLVPYLRTELFFLSELWSPIHRTCTCPCSHQGNKVRERNAGYIPTSVHISSGGVQYQTQMGSSRHLYLCKGMHLSSVWRTLYFYLDQSTAMLRCLQPVLGWPWPAALCPPQQHRKENTMEKLMGQAKDREITKLMYCLAMSSFDTLCQKTHLCHEGNRTNGKNVYMLQPQRFPNDWDCRKLGMNLLCLVKQGPVD